MPVMILVTQGALQLSRTFASNQLWEVGSTAGHLCMRQLESGVPFHLHTAWTNMLGAIRTGADMLHAATGALDMSTPSLMAPKNFAVGACCLDAQTQVEEHMVAYGVIRHVQKHSNKAVFQPREATQSLPGENLLNNVTAVRGL